MLKKELELKLVSSGYITESKLFHGTADGNVQDICLSGFNRSLAGANGKWCSKIKFAFFDQNLHMKQTLKALSTAAVRILRETSPTVANTAGKSFNA